jgi:hypothetical protein
MLYVLSGNIFTAPDIHSQTYPGMPAMKTAAGWHGECICGVPKLLQQWEKEQLRQGGSSFYDTIQYPGLFFVIYLHKF